MAPIPVGEIFFQPILNKLIVDFRRQHQWRILCTIRHLLIGHFWIKLAVRWVKLHSAARLDPSRFGTRRISIGTTHYSTIGTLFDVVKWATSFSSARAANRWVDGETRCCRGARDHRFVALRRRVAHRSYGTGARVHWDGLIAGLTLIVFGAQPKERKATTELAFEFFLSTIYIGMEYN